MNSIECPACETTDHHVIQENCFQCDRCHWYFMIDETGCAVEISLGSQNLEMS